MAGSRVWPTSVWVCGLAGMMLGSAGAAGRANAQETGRVAVESRATYAGNPVTVEMRDAQLKAVLDEITRQAGLSMVYSKDVLPNDRRVSVRLVDIPALDAYRIALRGTNLTVSISTTGRAIFSRSRDAATGIITGRVIDSVTKKAVFGATVMIQGTKLSAKTGDDGVYRITGVPVGTHTVIVRRLGYSVAHSATTVADDETTKADVVLSAATTALHTVVTTVTGPQRRLEVGNDIGLIKADSLMKAAPITTLSQLLTSRIPGLAVAQGQGTVGGDIRLQVRGLSSLTLSNEPIVIVDGVRYTSSAIATRRFLGNSGRESVSPLNDLNPNDVETVEIVKGPSAATLYGTDASNGVIVITTKRGKPGPARWDVYGTRDFTQIPHVRPQADEVWYGWGLTRFGEYISNCTILGVLERYCTQDSVTHAPSDGSKDAFSILKPSQSWTSGLAVSGGVPNLTYRIGGNFRSLIGAISVPDTAIKIAKSRGTRLPESFLRPNTTSSLGLESSVRATMGHGLELSLTGNYTRGETRSIDADGGPWQAGLNTENGGTAIANNIVDLFSRASHEQNQRLVGSLQMQFHPIQIFSARAVIGIDGDTRTMHEYVPRDSTITYYTLNPRGSVYDRQGRTNNTSADGGASLRLAFGRLRINTSVGGQYNRSTEDASEGKGSDLVPGTSSINFATTRTFTQIYSQRVSLGTYIEEMVGLNDRFFVTGAVRIDGATGFGDKYRAAGYPKISASWLLSQEPLFSRIPILTELRLRAAYGVSGQQAKPTAKLPFYGLAQSEAPGYGQSLIMEGVGNPELRPERTGEFERGLDASVFDRRVNVALTWYRRRVRDQIITQAIAAGLGYVPKNVGLTTGDGLETSITANVVDTRALSLSVSLNESRHNTKVLDLGGASPLKNDGGGYVVGYPIGGIFKPKYLGYEDKNGDGMLHRTYDGDPINEVFFTDTAFYIGVTNPPRQQTLITNVGLFQQRLRLSAILNRESGALTQRGFMNDVNRLRAVYDRTSPLDQQVLFYSQRDFEPRNFTRLREVSVAWTLPHRMTQAMRVSSGSVSLSGRNLALWTTYRGGDPESQAVDWSPIYRRAANGIPQNRTWLMRFDLSL